MQNAITIAKSFIRHDDLVVLPRKEYEHLLLQSELVHAMHEVKAGKARGPFTSVRALRKALES